MKDNLNKFMNIFESNIGNNIQSLFFSLNSPGEIYYSAFWCPYYYYEFVLLSGEDIHKYVPNFVDETCMNQINE